MRDAETTIGNLADKQTVAFIGVADEEGFPIVKAMLAPRTLLKRRDDGLDALVSIYSYIGQVKGDRRNT